MNFLISAEIRNRSNRIARAHTRTGENLLRDLHKNVCENANKKIMPNEVSVSGNWHIYSIQCN